MEISKTTISDQVFEYFRNKIMNRELLPEERIIETRIAKELGVSQGTVREALQKLDSMGLVEIKPYYGTFVLPFDEKKLKDAYDLRSLLECYSAPSICENITNDGINRMRELRNEMDEYAKNNDKRNLIVCDVQFHKEMILATENITLEKMWNIASVPQWTGYTIMAYDDIDYFPKSHDNILLSVINRDSEKLTKELEIHFSNAQEIAINNWKKLEGRKTN